MQRRLADIREDSSKLGPLGRLVAELAIQVESLETKVSALAAQVGSPETKVAESAGAAGSPAI